MKLGLLDSETIEDLLIGLRLYSYYIGGCCSIGGYNRIGVQGKTPDLLLGPQTQDLPKARIARTIQGEPSKPCIFIVLFSRQSLEKIMLPLWIDLRRGDPEGKTRGLPVA
jgi:hypothetical protein